MTIKVFCRAPSIAGYIGNPATGFQFTLPYDVCQSDGGDEGAPKSFQEEVVITVAIGDTPIDVYQQAFTAIATRCGELSYDTPTLADVFAYTPGLLSDMMPTLPQF